VALIAFGIFFICPFGPILIPAGLILIFLSFRKILAEKKIGQVELQWGSSAVAPGSHVALNLALTPRKTCRLNGITAKLTATERCTSGSGTNRTTHTHRIHERTVPLVAECDLAAFRPVRAEASIPVPEAAAYSFSADDNELVWELEVRIDIPLWPDWLEKRVLTVRPPVQAALAEMQPADEVPVGARSGEEFPPPSEETAPEPEPMIPSFGETDMVPEESAIAGPSGAFDERLDEPMEEPVAAPADADGPAARPPRATESALIDVVERLVSASRFGREREEIIQEHANRVFECTIRVDKIDRTFGYVPEERFRNGRTVTGAVSGTDCQVSLQMAAEHNEKLDACHSGDTIRADCKLLKWNGIYDRIDMQEVTSRA
jgi:hypothetical protein